MHLILKNGMLGTIPFGCNKDLVNIHLRICCGLTKFALGLL